jgi:thioesterase domain-containing protein
MQASELEDYLYQQIPISKQIGISVMSAGTNHVLLAAPLNPNINHCDTVFGGSASAVAILAAWSLIHLRLSGNGISLSHCHSAQYHGIYVA